MTVYIWTDAEAYGSDIFEKELWMTVDEIIAMDGRILSWLDNKRVLLRCRDKNFNNIGLSASDAEKVSECDCMLCSWDGFNQVKLKSVQSLLALGKTCRMFYIPQNKWVDISSEVELMKLDAGCMKDFVVAWGVDDPDDLPYEFWAELDSFMAAGDEINSNEEFIEEFFMDHHKYMKYRMLGSDLLGDVLKACDRFVVYWDGELQCPFQFMMLRLVLRKTCRMYYSPLKMWFDINSVDDIRRFVNERPRWSEKQERILADTVYRSPFSYRDRIDFLHWIGDKSNYVYEIFSLTEKLISDDTDIDDAYRKVLEYQSYRYLEGCITGLERALCMERERERKRRSTV